jgi:hypothetical protein
LPERPQALFAMTAENVPQVFPPEVLAQLRESVAVAPDTVVADFDNPRIRDTLARTEILVTGNEVARPGRVVAEEAGRLVRGEWSAYEVDPEALRREA